MTLKIVCKIRDLRKYQELTQENLAEELGISRQALIALEQGRSLPSLGLAMEIADFFERDIDEIFNDDFERGLPLQLPAPTDMGILEKEKQIIINIALPEINPKDINVEIEENNLIISGKIKHSQDDIESFFRTIPLPNNINTKKITANISGRVLKIVLPKDAKKRQKISVKID